MRRLAVIVAGSMVLGAAPASACGLGGERFFFNATPPDVPAGMAVIHGRLLMTGSRVQRAKEHMPNTSEGQFIGFMHQTGRPWRDALPIYAAPNSCNNVDHPGRSGQTVYMMGQLREARGQVPRRFVASGERYY